MATAQNPTTTQRSASTSDRGGRIGLVLLVSIASTLAFGLALTLSVFAGGEEGVITGSALGALGAGFFALAVLSSRFTAMPQRWAFVPAVALSSTGLVLALSSPGDRTLVLAGWIWPAFLAALILWSFRGARRSLHHWSRRAVLYPALVLLLVVAIGGGLETAKQATEAGPVPPAGGRTYLVADRALYLDCGGTGAPTVVLFNGFGARTPSWAWVQRMVSPTARVCVFDRAGQGWSTEAPDPQDGRELAADVHELLEAAGVPKPYVLAGHSVGGTYALVYADRYPDEVAGLALIDSATPDQFELPTYPRFYAVWRRASALLPSLARTGVTRLVLGSGSAGLPPEARDDARAFASSPRELRSDRTEFSMLPTVFDQAKALTSLNGKPLAVVTADVGAQRGWTSAQAKLARLSTNSVHLTARGATHAALLEDPRFAATSGRAIVDVVRRARGRGSATRAGQPGS